MHCGVLEEEEDLISSSSISISNSPSDRRQAQSLHSPLSIAISSSLSFDINNHSPVISSSPPCGFKELGAPSGLNLLVAALDAQDPNVFRQRQEESQIHLDEDFFSHQNTSDDDTCSSGKRPQRRKSSIPENCKDELYWEKRRRNNEAAKRSREKRRVSDMAMETRLMELSRENNLLKHELSSVKRRQVPNPTQSSPQLPLVPAEMPQVPNSTPPDLAAHFASLANQRSPFLPTPGLVNPLLAAMVPPAVIFQAIAQQRAIASPPGAANGRHTNPYANASLDGSAQAQQISSSILGNDQRQQPPLTPSMLLAARPGLSVPTSPGPPTASSFSDGKQYLRYKLLERQLQQQNLSSAVGMLSGSPHGLSLLGSAISAGAGCALKGPQPRSTGVQNSSCQPPPVKRPKMAPSKTDLTHGDAEAPLSLKECLSSLAVSLVSPSALASRAEKAAVGCGSSSPSNTGRTVVHSSPVANGDNQRSDYAINSHSNLPSSTVYDDGLACIGDLLRARTHSDSSQSSAGISSHGSSASTYVSVTGANALSPTAMMELEFRNSLSDRRRDSNNSDSGIVSDGASDRRAPGKRYRSDHERYVERRRRNNEAAKRCRANRRAMFEYRYQRAQELENENARLKDEMRQLSRELSELKEILAKRGGDFIFEAQDDSRLKTFSDSSDDSKINVDDDFKEAALRIDFDESPEKSGEETPLDFTVKKEK